jgi:hypothetical protein
MIDAQYTEMANFRSMNGFAATTFHIRGPTVAVHESQEGQKTVVYRGI